MGLFTVRYIKRQGRSAKVRIFASTKGEARRRAASRFDDVISVRRSRFLVKLAWAVVTIVVLAGLCLLA